MIRRLLRLIGIKPKRLLIGSAAANQLVRDEMAEQKDNGRVSRPVKHLIFPIRDRPPEPVSLAVDLLTERGLHVSDSQFGGGLIAEHRAVVASAQFDVLTDSLRHELDVIGYRYDGWECAIYKGGKPT